MGDAGALREIAGYAAAWSSIDLDVSSETDGERLPLPAAPVSLYALRELEKSIDAGALLREREIADPPYWALVWTGARAIAAVVASMSPPAGLRVLDLGCGLGLAGLSAAGRGAAVTFGDYLDAPLDFVRASVERLGALSCEVRRIDFTRDDPAQRYDLILAADIVYDPAHYAPLALFLDGSLAADGMILLTESLRADARVFLEGMRALGYTDEKRAIWVMEDGRRERSWLHTLERAANAC